MQTSQCPGRTVIGVSPRNMSTQNIGVGPQDTAKQRPLKTPNLVPCPLARDGHDGPVSTNSPASWQHPGPWLEWTCSSENNQSQRFQRGNGLSSVRIVSVTSPRDSVFGGGSNWQRLVDALAREVLMCCFAHQVQRFALPVLATRKRPQWALPALTINTPNPPSHANSRPL